MEAGSPRAVPALPLTHDSEAGSSRVMRAPPLTHDSEAGSSRAMRAPPLTHDSEAGQLPRDARAEVSDDKRDEDVVVTVTVGCGRTGKCRWGGLLEHVLLALKQADDADNELQVGTTTMDEGASRWCKPTVKIRDYVRAGHRRCGLVDERHGRQDLYILFLSWWKSGVEALSPLFPLCSERRASSL